MRNQFLQFCLFCALIMGHLHSFATSKDIKIDLTNGNLPTEQEATSASSVKFGVAIGTNGSSMRVTANNASAEIVPSGKFHSNEHGWNNFSSTTAVEGPVKTSMATRSVTKTSGGTFNNADASVVYPFQGNTTDPTVNTPEKAFTMASFAMGTNIQEKGSKTYDGIKYTCFTSTAANEAGANDANAMEWKIVPAKGLTFTPKKVSATIRRFGTDGGLIDVKVRNEEGQTAELGTGLKPARDKTPENDKTSGDANYRTAFEYDIPEGFNTKDGFYLIVNLYSISNKNIGISNVNISGSVDGTLEDVTKHAISVIASPAEAGTVSVYPSGSEYDEGTELRITATRNFGYKFVNWTDGKGNIASTEPQFKITLNEDVELTANFEKINTYSLNVDVTEPAKYYMVTVSPEPTVIDNKNMFEEGTKVTLTAVSNKIMTFNSWSNGETSSELVLTMDKNQDLKANYSAIDFIAAWDFYRPGKDGRKADFAAADNDIDMLIMRTEDGTTSSWLDKSQSSGGYEGKPAAVNWTTTGLGKYYWQTMVNASAFTNIKVSAAMALNYNAYSKYNVDYSLDGENWTNLGAITIPGAKNWTTGEFELPAEANNQKALYLRWKADLSSEILGTSSNNDGIAISEIFITGDGKMIDDGKAPVFVSSVPAKGAENVSANGSIVLTFDEKVKLAADNVTATLNDKQLQAVVYGKTVKFDYKGLDYDTEYTFTLPGNSISDLTDNTIADAITLAFKTKVRPTITKALYDFIVPDDGSFTDALAAAAKRVDNTQRFRIFVKQGNYIIPANEKESVTGNDGKKYPSATTKLNTPNVSIIGEDMGNTSFVNTVPTCKAGEANPLEGIGVGDVLLLQSGATNTYFQDITLKSGMIDATGRNIVLNDKSNKTICKNVCLWAYQDTYVSNNERSRFYFEGGLLRGRTDFLCGKGDVFYNAVDLQMCEKGGYLAVPSVPAKYGYIFKDCTIKAETAEVDGNYTLGRPWGSGTPIALFIGTKMEAIPSPLGWNEMGTGWPARFAEYNSTTSTGSVIDLSTRKTAFGGNHVNNPILTADEAAQYTLETVMGGADNWDPTAATEQASAPEQVRLEGNNLTWNNSNYVLCWAICKDGKVIDFTTENTYTVTDTKANWSVRAANEMGGLGEAAKAEISTGIVNINTNSTDIVDIQYYAVDGSHTNANYKGIVLQVTTFKDGKKVTVKTMKK